MLAGRQPFQPRSRFDEELVSLLIFVLVLYITFDKVMEAYPLIQRFLSTSQFALATVAIVLSGVFLAAYFALLYIGVKALLYYRHLKNKYSKLVQLTKPNAFSQLAGQLVWYWNNSTPVG